MNFVDLPVFSIIFWTSFGVAEEVTNTFFSANRTSKSEMRPFSEIGGCVSFVVKMHSALLNHLLMNYAITFLLCQHSGYSTGATFTGHVDFKLIHLESKGQLCWNWGTKKCSNHERESSNHHHQKKAELWKTPDWSKVTLQILFGTFFEELAVR